MISNKGGHLTRAIYKIFEKPENIINYSLRDLVIAIRRQTKLYAGIGRSDIGWSSQCVDFHETMEYKIYFKKAN